MLQIGFLELGRQTRRENWDTFMQQQFEKSAKVDQEMEKKIEFVSSATQL